MPNRIQFAAALSACWLAASVAMADDSPYALLTDFLSLRSRLTEKCMAVIEDRQHNYVISSYRISTNAVLEDFQSTYDTSQGCHLYTASLATTTVNDAEMPEPESGSYSFSFALTHAIEDDSPIRVTAGLNITRSFSTNKLYDPYGVHPDNWDYVLVKIPVETNQWKSYDRYLLRGFPTFTITGGTSVNPNIEVRPSSTRFPYAITNSDLSFVAGHARDAGRYWYAETNSLFVAVFPGAAADAYSVDNGGSTAFAWRPPPELGGDGPPTVLIGESANLTNLAFYRWQTYSDVGADYTNGLPTTNFWPYPAKPYGDYGNGASIIGVGAPRNVMGYTFLEHPENRWRVIREINETRTNQFYPFDVQPIKLKTTNDNITSLLSFYGPIFNANLYQDSIEQTTITTTWWRATIDGAGNLLTYYWDEQLNTNYLVHDYHIAFEFYIDENHQECESQEGDVDVEFEECPCSGDHFNVTKTEPVASISTNGFDPEYNRQGPFTYEIPVSERVYGINRNRRSITNTCAFAIFDYPDYLRRLTVVIGQLAPAYLAATNWEAIDAMLAEGDVLTRYTGLADLMQQQKVGTNNYTQFVLAESNETPRVLLGALYSSPISSRKIIDNGATVTEYSVHHQFLPGSAPDTKNGLTYHNLSYELETIGIGDTNGGIWGIGCVIEPYGEVGIYGEFTNLGRVVYRQADGLELYGHNQNEVLVVDNMIPFDWMGFPFFDWTSTNREECAMVSDDYLALYLAEGYTVSAPPSVVLDYVTTRQLRDRQRLLDGLRYLPITDPTYVTVNNVYKRGFIPTTPTGGIQFVIASIKPEITAVDDGTSVTYHCVSKITQVYTPSAIESAYYELSDNGMVTVKSMNVSSDLLRNKRLDFTIDAAPLAWPDDTTDWTWPVPKPGIFAWKGQDPLATNSPNLADLPPEDLSIVISFVGSAEYKTVPNFIGKRTGFSQKTKAYAEGDQMVYAWFGYFNIMKYSPYPIVYDERAMLFKENGKMLETSPYAPLCSAEDSGLWEAFGEYWSADCFDPYGDDYYEFNVSFYQASGGYDYCAGDEFVSAFLSWARNGAGVSYFTVSTNWPADGERAEPDDMLVVFTEQISQQPTLYNYVKGSNFLSEWTTHTAISGQSDVRWRPKVIAASTCDESYGDVVTLNGASWQADYYDGVRRYCSWDSRETTRFTLSVAGYVRNQLPDQTTYHFIYRRAGDAWQVEHNAKGLSELELTPNPMTPTITSTSTNHPYVTSTSISNNLSQLVYLEGDGEVVGGGVRVEVTSTTREPSGERLTTIGNANADVSYQLILELP